MAYHLIDSKTIPQHLGRNASDDGVWRAAPRNHCPGGDDRPTADGDALQDRDIGPCPNIVFHGYGGIVLRQFLMAVKDERAYHVCTVVARYYRRMWPEYHLTTYRERSLGTIKDTALRDAAAIADAEIPQPFQVARHWPQIYALATMLHAALVERSPKLVPQIRE